MHEDSDAGDSGEGQEVFWIALPAAFEALVASQPPNASFYFPPSFGSPQPSSIMEGMSGIAPGRASEIDVIAPIEAFNEAIRIILPIGQEGVGLGAMVQCLLKGWFQNDFIVRIHAEDLYADRKAMSLCDEG